jgi:hypothetical protein
MGYYNGEEYVSTSYGDIVNGFGSVLLEVTDGDYQGDSRFLLKDGERVGWLQFGWGSCSGCDALEACDSKADFDELAASLKSEVKWFDSKKAALKFFEEHDWEADYSWHDDEQKQFVAQAKELLAK